MPWVFLLVTAAAAAVIAPNIDWASARLTDAYGGTAELLERRVAETVERAASLRIPLRSPEVVNSGFAYLARLLEENPEVRFVALADGDPATDLIFYEGTNRRRLGGLLPDPDLVAAVDGGGTGIQPVTVGNFIIRARPLAVDDRVFAVLYVGVDRRLAPATLSELLLPVILAVVGGLAVAYQAVVIAVEGYVGPALDRLRRQATDARAGSFRRLAARGGQGDIGHAARSADAVVWRLRDRFERMATHADEVRHAVFDPAVADRVEVARRALIDRWEAKLADDRPLDETPVADRLRPAVFAVAAAVGLAGWPLASTVPTAWEAAVFLLALIVPSVLVAITVGIAAPGLRSRETAMFGAAVMAVGLLAHEATMAPVFLPVILGVGLGFVLAAVRGRTGRRRICVWSSPLLTGAGAGACWGAGLGAADVAEVQTVALALAAAGAAAAWFFGDRDPALAKPDAVG